MDSGIGNTYNSDLSFWIEKVPLMVEGSQIQQSYVRPLQYSSNKEVVEIILGDHICDLVGKVAGNEYMCSSVYIAVILACISRHGDKACVVAGIPPEKGNKNDTLLPLLIECKEQESFYNLLECVDRECREAYSHCNFNFNELIANTEFDSDTNNYTLLNYIIFDEDSHETPSDYRQDITFSIHRNKHEVSIKATYNPILYQKEDMIVLLEHISTLLKSVLSNPDMSLEKHTMMSLEEREKVLSWNNTEVLYKNTMCLHSVFEEQVHKNPDLLAIKFMNESLTYSEFNILANKLSHFIRKLGIGPEVPVGIYMRRSSRMLIAIYAVLKAGGAYVPLDPDYPEDRLKYIVDDICPPVIITEGICSDFLSTNSRHIVDLNLIWDEVLSMPSCNPDSGVTLDNMAYIIYTSGSTGKPKGVIITHRAIVNRLFWMQDYFGITNTDRVLQKTPFSFDVSVWELFWPLMYGAGLIIAKPEGHKDSSYLIKLINEEQITTIHFVPSMLQRFLDNKNVSECKSLKRVICSGEALDKYLVDDFFNKFNIGLFNLYGPTEAAVDVTYYKCKKQDKRKLVPIGRPISNCQLYILNQNLELSPIGVPGELYIGGVCLAREYHNQPELTAERFISNPFSNDTDSRLYKTGDWVRYRWDGEIEFLNRKDNQVKIRGFRIELGEIENCIRQHPRVSETVVSVYEDSIGERKIIGYLVPRKEVDSCSNELKQVDQWQKIYDTTYSSSDIYNEKDHMSDFSGWISSYTGKQIPQEQMIEWVSTTVERILDLKPKNVLEIGCGTGLLLYRIAPHVDSYIGCDLSSVVVEKLTQEIADKGEELSHVKVYHGSADDFSYIGDQKFDCIIINSVIQLFPSIRYLMDVIVNALKVLDDNGCLFIGDIRNYEQMNLFHNSVQFFQSKPTTKVSFFRHQVMNRIDKEKELLIHPDFFVKLAEYCHDVSSVDLMVKAGVSINELTKFRYDAVIYKGKKNQLTKPEIINWDSTPISLEDLECKLKDSLLEEYNIINVPNERVTIDSIIYNKINSLNSDETLETLYEIIKSKDSSFGLEPNDIYTLCKKFNKKAVIKPSGIDKVDVIIKPYVNQSENNEINMSSDKKGVADIEAYEISKYANNPTKVLDSSNILDEVKQYIETMLPNYMVPSVFMIIDKIPLLPNGKLDRKSLPEPVFIRPDISTEYIPPQSPTEEKIRSIWSDILGIEQIGIHDSFFELGGHSLLALKLLSSLSEQFLVEISLQEFLEKPTIANIAVILEDCMTKNPDDVDVLVKIIPEPDKRFEPFQLNDLQQAYFVGRSAEFELGNVATHVYFEIECDNYNHECFENALNRVIERHDMLRCVFEGNGTQKVLKEVPRYKISVFDLEKYTPSEVEAHLSDVREQMSNKTLKFDEWPLFEVKVSKVCNGRAYIHAYYDGLIIDAWSQNILINEIIELYNNPKVELKPLDITFRDYVKAEQSLKKSSLYEKSKEYWCKRVKDIPEAPDLLIIQTSESIAKPTYIRLQRTLEKNEWNGFKHISGKVGVTPFIALLTVFGKVIASWSRRQRFTLSIPSFNRFELHPSVNQLVGEFASFMFIDFNNERGKSIAQLANDNKVKFCECMDNRYFNGVEILREIAKTQGGTVKSLMPVVFTSLLNMDELENKNYKQVYSITQTSQVWIDAIVSEDNGQLIIAWDCVKELFDTTMLEDMLDIYISVLRKLSAQEESWYNDEWLLIPQYQKNLIDNINNTYKTLPEKTLSDLLDESFKKYGSRVAVQTLSTKLTYNELFSRAMNIAQHLIEQGIKPNELVGIVMVKGWEQIAAVIGTVYAGAAYLPLAADLPDERLIKCLEHAKVKVVLTQSWISESLAVPEGTLKLNVDTLHTQDSYIGALPGVVEGDNLIYVIYTSGSTGFPKGVMVGQKGLLNSVLCTNEEYGIRETDSVLALTNLHHDMAAYDIFGMLISGGKIVIPDPDKAKDPEHWADLIIKYGVTVWNSVPAMMEMILQHFEGNMEIKLPTLRLAFMGGDWIGLTIHSRLKKIAPSVDLISVGGPTETTLWNIWYKVKEINSNWKSVPYGKPIANTKYHLLNDNLEYVPIGVIGTMYCEGIGVAQGYLNDDENTKKSFIIHPKLGTRLYRTGDLGRYMPDGNIEFMGREDFQVKINGQRIELGEIEHVLSQYPGIRNVIATVIPNALNSIAVYYQHDTVIDEHELRCFANSKLPRHMIPKYYIRLDSIPLTSNGKVDRKNLPLPVALTKKTDIATGTESDIEAKLKSIFSEALNVEYIEDDDNFFSLGGNSLIAIQTIRKIRETLSPNFSISEFFSDSSIKAIANAIVSRKTENLKIEQVKIQRQPAMTHYPLSFTQEGICFADYKEHSYKYCLPASITINGELDIEKFKNAIEAVISRHSILRTIFKFELDEPVQEILPIGEVNLKIIDIQDEYKDNNMSVEKLMIEEARKSFDITVGPLYRFTLVRINKDEFVFLISLHHIISDEYSFVIFIKDLIECYIRAINESTNELQELPIQYSDYSCWINNLLKSGSLDNEILYWKEKLSGDLPYVRLPLIKEPDWKVYKGKYRQLSIEDSTIVSLKRICTKVGASLFMGFCGVLYSLLYRITGDNDISFGTAISGRRWKETEKMMGLFVNVLLLRTDVIGEHNFISLLMKVKETVTGAFTHQTLPFEKCINEAKIDRSKINLPYHVTFNYIDSSRESYEVDGIRFGPLSYTKETVSHNLGLFIENVAGKYYCAFSYKDDIFDEETIEKIATYFEKLIIGIVDDPEKAIIDYQLTDDSFNKDITETSKDDSDFNFMDFT